MRGPDLGVSVLTFGFSSLDPAAQGPLSMVRITPFLTLHTRARMHPTAPPRSPVPPPHDAGSLLEDMAEGPRARAEGSRAVPREGCRSGTPCREHLAGTWEATGASVTLGEKEGEHLA